MAIGIVQEIAKVTGDGVTSVNKAFTSNVTSGNLTTVELARYSNGTDTALVAGDVTKSGTSSIGTIALDSQAHVNGTNPCQSGNYSALVTGGGSLTFTASGPAGSYFEMTIDEYSPGAPDTWSATAATRLEASNSNTTIGSTSPATTGNGTAAGEALFTAVVAIDHTDTNTNPVAGNSFTLLDREVDASSHQSFASARRIASALTTQGTWTISTSPGTLHAWAASLAVYKVTTAGGATIKSPLIGGRLINNSMLVGGRLIQ